MRPWVRPALILFVSVGGLVVSYWRTESGDLSLLLAQPVKITATVTDLEINGFGGDPLVDYRYEVRGHRYTGWGPPAELGNPHWNDLRPGATITIEYAAGHPDVSCSCDPGSGQWEASHSPWCWGLGVSFLGLVTGAIWLCGVATSRIRTRRSASQQS